MPEYIIECISAFGEDLNGSASTPAKHNLFEPSEGEMAEQLGPEKSELFHHIESKLLYV